VANSRVSDSGDCQSLPFRSQYSTYQPMITAPYLNLISAFVTLGGAYFAVTGGSFSNTGIQHSRLPSARSSHFSAPARTPASIGTSPPIEVAGGTADHQRHDHSRRIECRAKVRAFGHSTDGHPTLGYRTVGRLLRRVAIGQPAVRMAALECSHAYADPRRRPTGAGEPKRRQGRHPTPRYLGILSRCTPP
jgi:hypothetical protein